MAESHLLIAAENGNPAILQSALTMVRASGGNVNCRDKNANTPLILAAKGGHLMCVMHLLQHPGVDVHARDRIGRTSLSQAAEGGYRQICEELLKLGALVDRPDDQTNTPLHYAAAKGHIEAAKLLLEHHADINMRNSDGKTPATLASVNEKEEMVSFLLGYPMNMRI